MLERTLVVFACRPSLSEYVVRETSMSACCSLLPSRHVETMIISYRRAPSRRLHLMNGLRRSHRREISTVYVQKQTRSLQPRKASVRSTTLSKSKNLSAFVSFFLIYFFFFLPVHMLSSLLPGSDRHVGQSLMLLGPFPSLDVSLA